MACSHLPISVFIYVPLRPPSQGCIEEEGVGGCGCWGRGLERKARCISHVRAWTAVWQEVGPGLFCPFLPLLLSLEARAELVTSLFFPFFLPQPPLIWAASLRMSSAQWGHCSTHGSLWDNASLAKEDEGRKGRAERVNTGRRGFFCPWCSLAIVAGSKITLCSCPPTPLYVYESKP